MSGYYQKLSLLTICLVSMASNVARAFVYSEGTLESWVGGCDPETKANTFEKVDRAMTALAREPKWRDAKFFRGKIDDVAQIKDINEKYAAYLAFVGVNAKTPKEVSAFVGARDFNPYIANAKKNLRLTEPQVVQVIGVMRKVILESIAK